MVKLAKEKLAGITGSASGITSLLGSYQVCHNLCIGLITLLSTIGIAVAGMPLLFLTKVAVPLWTAAGILLLITAGLYFRMYFKHRRVSPKLIIFNSGVLIAGVPFQAFQRFQVMLWSMGGALIAWSLILFVKGKVETKRARDML